MSDNNQPTPTLPDELCDLWVGYAPLGMERRVFSTKAAAISMELMDIKGYVSAAKVAKLLQVKPNTEVESEPDLTQTLVEKSALIFERRFKEIAGYKFGELRFPVVTEANATHIISSLVSTLIDFMGQNPTVTLSIQQVRALQVYLGRSIPNVSNEALKSLIDKAQWVCQDLGGKISVEQLRAAGKKFDAEYKHTVPVTRDEIRNILLANGFKVKEGQQDLMPYVFAAAEAVVIEALKKAGA